jgi:hypothetical protein
MDIAAQTTALHTEAPAPAKDRFCALTYTVSNLGDEIQTLAALQYLPEKNVGLVAREWLHNNRWAGQPKIILNGWFLHEGKHWPPAPHFDPLIVSFHAAPSVPEILDGAGLEYLRAYAKRRPIGARDRSTLERLRDKGIDAYFSGCLTLTLRPFENAGRSDVIFAVDLDEAETAQLRKKTDRPIVPVAHIDTTPTAPWERLGKAERLLRQYQAAHAVVTSRLHAALPSIALGAPVLLVARNPNESRFGGLRDHLHSVSASDFLANRLDYDFETPPANPTTWLPMAAELQRTCEAFTGVARHETRLALAAAPLR